MRKRGRKCHEREKEGYEEGKKRKMGKGGDERKLFREGGSLDHCMVGR